MTSANRVTQAQQINANVPTQVQTAFNENSINYYDPGNGAYYYAKQNDMVIQVARSCNCYVSGTDGQLHYLTATLNQGLSSSSYNFYTNLPSATTHTVSSGDTLSAIADRYGVDLGTLKAANPSITNPDLIYPNQAINVPAQGYTVGQGDTLDSIAQSYNLGHSDLMSLNPQIENPDLIYPDQIVNVPANSLSTPFTYTISSGDYLSSIADRYSLGLDNLQKANPQIENPDVLYPDEVINVPIYMPSQGLVNYSTASTGEAAPTLVGVKFKRAIPDLITTTIQVGPTSSPIIVTIPAPNKRQVQQVVAPAGSDEGWKKFFR